MTSRAILIAAAVITALAACANPAEGVAQTPETEPPAERSAQAEKDDPDMAAAKQAADDAAAAAQAAADTMQAAMDAGHVAEPPPAYEPPSPQRLRAIPARMTTAQLRERIIALIGGLQQPDDLEKPAVERVLGVSLQRVPGAEDAWPNRPQHHAEIAIDDTWIATVTVIDGKDGEFGIVNITTSNVWRDPECRLQVRDVVEPLSAQGFDSGPLGTSNRRTILSKFLRGDEYRFGATIHEFIATKNPSTPTTCIARIKVYGGEPLE